MAFIKNLPVLLIPFLLSSCQKKQEEVSIVAEQKMALLLLGAPKVNGEWNPAWKAVMDTQRQTGRVGFVVVSVMDGPDGDEPQRRDMRDGVVALKQSGIPVLGYIDSESGNKGVVAIKQEAREWLARYGVGSFYIDQGIHGCTSRRRAYYTDMRSALKEVSPSMNVALSPAGGVEQGDECLIEYADVLVTYQGPGGAAYRKAQFPEWVTKLPPEKSWHILYGLPNAEEQDEDVALSGERSVRYVQATSEQPPFPYDKLSAWWSRFVKAMEPIKN